MPDYKPNQFIRAFAVLALAVLVLLLGLNVSAMGLIEIPRSSLYLVLELTGLILALNLVFVVVFLVLGWNSFFRSRPMPRASGREIPS